MFEEIYWHKSLRAKETCVLSKRTEKTPLFPQTQSRNNAGVKTRRYQVLTIYLPDAILPVSYQFLDSRFDSFLFCKSQDITMIFNEVIRECVDWSHI